MRALLVDDDHELARLLSDYLVSHGVSLDHVADGPGALDKLKDPVPYDIVLLDVMLPGMDGFGGMPPDSSRTRRADGHADGAGEDSARGDWSSIIGADDYVPKPFNPRELLARMRAVLRRARPVAPASSERLEVGDLVVDVPAHQATLGGQALTLTSFELRVLVALARRAGETVTREELATAVLPKLQSGARYDPSVDRSLDVHVSHLRHKIGDDAREPKRIRTVRGVGYVLVKRV